MLKVEGVLCSGSLIHDTLVHPVDDPQWGTTTFVEAIQSQTGGNGSNTSIALATLGVPVKVLGFVGRDGPGELVLDHLNRVGVDTRFVVALEGSTAATVVLISSNGNRKFLHRLGVSNVAFGVPVTFEPGMAAGISHYHLASLFILPRLRQQSGQTLARARAAGMTTSLDTNWDATGRWMADLEPCLPHLDFLFMNEDEARMVTGKTDPADAAVVVRNAGVQTAVMKLGSRGCAIFTSAESIYCQAHDVAVRDTTGAGDCFVAGFLAALHRGKGLTEAGQFANAVGALSVQQVGAVAGLRSYDEVQRWRVNASLRAEV